MILCRFFVYLTVLISITAHSENNCWVEFAPATFWKSLVEIDPSVTTAILRHTDLLANTSSRPLKRIVDTHSRGGRVQLERMRHEGMRSHLTTIERRKQYFSFTSEDGTDFVRINSGRFAELLKLSQQESGYRELLFYRLVYHRKDFRSEIEFGTESEFSSESALDRLESDIKKIFPLALLGRRAAIHTQHLGFIQLVHTHPTEEHIERHLNSDGSVAASYYAVFELSPEDRALAKNISFIHPQIPVVITAITSSGFNFSAVYLAGKDVTLKTPQLDIYDALVF